jgi:hypothetical protein
MLPSRTPEKIPDSDARALAKAPVGCGARLASPSTEKIPDYEAPAPAKVRESGTSRHQLLNRSRY